MNKKGIAISGIIYAILILFLILIFSVLGTLGSRKLILDKLKNSVMKGLNNESVGQFVYVDKSGANAPRLLDNMIPVYYDGTNWIYADIYKEWYDYNDKKWANAVVLNNDSKEYKVNETISMDDIALMYVWIPRYKYTIFNGNNEGVLEQEINIQFERGLSSSGTVSCVDVNFVNNPTSTVSEICTDNINGSIVNGVSTYTHPAFTFGDEELTGFWVGKFEVSGSIEQITIKPNVDSLRNQKVSDFFTSIQNISTKYTLDGNSHMMKNMEWGAVAYLKQSIYGLGTTDIGINNYYNNGVYKTGCGAAVGSAESIICNPYDAGGVVASTTGNIYGVYDMSGGAYEYVMANMVNSSGAFSGSNVEFEKTPDAKYYDAYAYDSSLNTTHARGKLGDATKETLLTFGSYSGGWARDHAYFISMSNYWFGRGGCYSDSNYAGVFYFGSNNGRSLSHTSARTVIIKD